MWEFLSCFAWQLFSNLKILFIEGVRPRENRNWSKCLYFEWSSTWKQNNLWFVLFLKSHLLQPSHLLFYIIIHSYCIIVLIKKKSLNYIQGKVKLFRLGLLQTKVFIFHYYYYCMCIDTIQTEVNNFVMSSVTFSNFFVQIVWKL